MSSGAPPFSPPSLGRDVLLSFYDGRSDHGALTSSVLIGLPPVESIDHVDKSALKAENQSCFMISGLLCLDMPAACFPRAERFSPPRKPSRRSASGTARFWMPLSGFSDGRHS